MRLGTFLVHVGASDEVTKRHYSIPKEFMKCLMCGETNRECCCAYPSEPEAQS